MNDQAERKCKNCDFYHDRSYASYSGGRGECRYNPPIVSPGGDKFPDTVDDQWCGRFKRRSDIIIQDEI